MHGVVSSVVSRLYVVSTLTVMLGVADALTTSKTVYFVRHGQVRPVYFVRHGQVRPAAPFHPVSRGSTGAWHARGRLSTTS